MRDPNYPEYIRLVLKRMRDENQKAMNASLEWEERSEALRKWALEKGWDFSANGADLWKYREMRDKDMALDDAMKSWSWHEREAKRMAETLSAEYHASLLLEGSTD